MKFIAALFLLLTVLPFASAQTLPKIYRGSIGDKHIEMRLNVNDKKVSGTYFYDQLRQNVTLDGAYDAKGQLQLVESVKKEKTGRFTCKAETDAPDVDLECEWSRPNGTGQRLVYLTEQGIRFTSEIQVLPKTIIDRKTKANVSYPELTGTSVTDAMTKFNQLIESRARVAMKEFNAESAAEVFDTTYNILLADENKISVEMTEYSDAGGAHPNTRLWTLNYDLKNNKELSLTDVFRDGDEYKSIIADFATKDINRRAERMELDEARRNNRKPEKQDPIIAEDGLPEMDTWALSTKGFAVYFDFPHVMAVFDKTIVPYGVLARMIKPGGPIPLLR